MLTTVGEGSYLAIVNLQRGCPSPQDTMTICLDTPSRNIGRVKRKACVGAENKAGDDKGGRSDRKTHGWSCTKRKRWILRDGAGTEGKLRGDNGVLIPINRTGKSTDLLTKLVHTPIRAPTGLEYLCRASLWSGTMGTIQGSSQQTIS